MSAGILVTPGYAGLQYFLTADGHIIELQVGPRAPTETPGSSLRAFSAARASIRAVPTPRERRPVAEVHALAASRSGHGRRRHCGDVGGRRHGGVVAEEPHDADEEPGDAEEPGAAPQLPAHGLRLVVTGDVLAFRRLTDRAPPLSGRRGSPTD